MTKPYYNQLIFDGKGIWENYDSSGEIKARIPAIMARIPTDVRSIIDIGCGNGEITNRFPEDYRVLGVDLSEEALKYVEREKIRCSCDNIPQVKDQEYDMVFSSELLEHLPLEMLENTLSEFKRIASKYIYISVPNREQLEVCDIKCPSCDAVFHAYGHLHSFTEEKIGQLLGSDFRVIWHTTTGKRVRGYNRLLLKWRHKHAAVYFAPSDNTICPNCENRKYPKHKGNILSKICNGLNLLIPVKKKNYWLMVLLERVT